MSLILDCHLAIMLENLVNNLGVIYPSQEVNNLIRLVSNSVCDQENKLVYQDCNLVLMGCILWNREKYPMASLVSMLVTLVNSLDLLVMMVNKLEKLENILDWLVSTLVRLVNTLAMLVSMLGLSASK